MKELKAAMEDGPDLGDFIAGVVPREGEGGYSGKLKLEKGKVYDFRWLGYLHCRSMPLAHTVTLSFRRQKVETATLAKNGNSDGKEFLQVEGRPKRFKVGHSLRRGEVNGCLCSLPLLITRSLFPDVPILVNAGEVRRAQQQPQSC